MIAKRFGAKRQNKKTGTSGSAVPVFCEVQENFVRF
jgi:hypothetical protein